jgi:hypothetical protein
MLLRQPPIAQVNDIRRFFAVFGGFIGNWITAVSSMPGEGDWKVQTGSQGAPCRRRRPSVAATLAITLGLFQYGVKGHGEAA